VDSRANLIATAQNMTKPIRMWPTGKKRIALTYDDGPHPTITPRLLELLREKNARATFFLLGRSLKARPDIGQAILDAGMEVGNHSMTHPSLSSRNELVVRAELESMNELIRTTLNRNPTLMRPPYGATNARVEKVCEELGLKIINWSVDTDDWRPNMTEERMKQRILAGMTDGAIILMHDRSEKAIHVTAWAIDEIRKAGYELVTVSELLGLKPPQPVVDPAVFARAREMGIMGDQEPTSSSTTALPADPDQPVVAMTEPSLPAPVRSVSSAAPRGNGANPGELISPVAPRSPAIRIEDAGAAKTRTGMPQTEAVDRSPSPLDLPLVAPAPTIQIPAPPVPSPLAAEIPEEVLTPLPAGRR
jgi:peptidoglycan/xylan/chitin deacetylase (PgdA/CDA1 family)